MSDDSDESNVVAPISLSKTIRFLTHSEVYREEKSIDASGESRSHQFQSIHSRSRVVHRDRTVEHYQDSFFVQESSVVANWTVSDVAFQDD